jgi:hypothetical protein
VFLFGENVMLCAGEGSVFEELRKSKSELSDLQYLEQFKYLIERLGVLVETAMGFFQAIVDRVE